MIPKSGYRFSEKIMLQETNEGADAAMPDQALRMPHEKENQASRSGPGETSQNQCGDEGRAQARPAGEGACVAAACRRTPR
jgi:hypothetical protein